MSDTVVTINNGFSTRTSTSGRQRTTIVCRSEPLVHNLDPKQLGAGPAVAIAEHLRQRVLGIVARASEATLERRRRAAAAPNLPSNAARYSGGRIGATPPNQSDRLFNDSGRLAKSIVARAASGDSYVVNVAANRLDPRSFTASAFAAMLELLKRYVPEIADPRMLMDSIPVRKAIKDGMRQMIQKQTARIDELRSARAKAIVGIGRSLLSLVA